MKDLSKLIHIVFNNKNQTNLEYLLGRRCLPGKGSPGSVIIVCVFQSSCLLIDATCPLRPGVHLQQLDACVDFTFTAGI